MPKVLIIDDDIDGLFSARFLLKKNGHEVIVLHKAENVIQEVERTQPDLILLDVFLSGADGRDVCQAIKQRDTLNKIPVVLYSADDTVAKTFTHFGANDFIAKPFDIYDFVATINAHINADVVVAN